MDIKSKGRAGSLKGNTGESFYEDDLQHVKIPPFSKEAERSVIGGLMLDNSFRDEINILLKPSDFYAPEHRTLYEIMMELSEAGHPLDFVTLSNALEDQKKLEKIGGIAYLTDLVKNTPSAANIKAYGAIVREKAILRQLLSASSEIADKVYFPEGLSCRELVDIAEQKVFAIAEHGSQEQRPTHAKDIVAEVVEKLDNLVQKPGGVTGESTGYVDLDKLTSGLQPADLVIIAGRPSMGKTTFAMNIAEYVAMNSTKPVLVFSLEMPKDAIMLRTLSSFSRVDQSAIRSGKIQDHDWTKLFSSMSLISERMNMYIDDTPALSPSEMRSRARRVARENGGLSMIVVDYLQLMQVPGSKEGRTNEVSEISRNLKALAKELGVPVIALSQLSRKNEERQDKRPMLSDLRESGAIEQDADLIMFVYRDEVYNPDSQDKGTAEIIIGKHRNGPIGMVRLTFSGQFCRFDDYAPQRMGAY
jgi:replicative DNA helicase